MSTASFTKEQVIDVLKTVYDLGIPVNVYDLGLVYDVDIEESEVNIVMTLTSPSCPSAKEIPLNMENKVVSVLGAEKCMVHIVWNPPWGPQMISDAGKKVLGMDESADDDDDFDDDE